MATVSNETGKDMKCTSKQMATDNFFFQREQVINSDRMRQCRSSSVRYDGMGDVRPDDDIGLVPNNLHVRVIKDLDWYARTISISARVSQVVMV